MPTPVTREIRSLRHSRIVIVVLQDGAKNHWSNISKKNNSERKVSNLSSNGARLAEKMNNLASICVIIEFRGRFLDKKLYICKRNKVYSNIIDYESKSFSLFSFSSLYEQC